MPCKVGVAGGRLDLTVPEELADHRQALTQGESPGRVGVPEVVNSYVLKPGFLANDPPRCVQVAQAGAGRRPDITQGLSCATAMVTIEDNPEAAYR